jgi:hypothetical protein
MKVARAVWPRPWRMVSVAKVVRAFTEAFHFIKTNKEETKTLIGRL